MDEAPLITDLDGMSAGSARPAHFVHVFPSFAHGGVPIRIATIINRFAARYRHTIIALDGDTASASRLDGGLSVTLSDPGIDKSRPLATLAGIRRHLVGLRPDLLLTYNWGSIEWALVNRFIGRVPHIHLESGFGTDEADGQLFRRVAMRRIALAGTRSLVVPSVTLVDLATHVWKIAPGRISHIPNGVDCDRFAAPPDPAAAPGFAPKQDELVVGTVAPLRPEKNLQRLIRAFAAIADGHQVRLLIVGDGAERPALEAAARDAGVAGRVVFAGHVEQPEKLYGLMDVFAISSDTEQMPNTLLQAMAASRPVAGVDVGDIKANLPPPNRALIVPKVDEAAFSASIGRLLGDPSLRRELGAANRAHVREFYHQERMFEAYGALFDKILAASRHARSDGCQG